MLAPLSPPASSPSRFPPPFSVPSARFVLRKTPANSATNSQPTNKTINADPERAILDAASRISPLFATLTKNTGGGGTTSSASHLLPVASSIVHSRITTSFFHTLTHSFALHKIPSPIHSILPALFPQNTGRCTPQHESSSASICSLTAIPFRIRTSEKRTCKLSGMNTSKTQDLKLFRMNTYKKRGRGAGCGCAVISSAPYAYSIARNRSKSFTSHAPRQAAPMDP